jgi:DNA-binding FrmR family transcriptional regulator
MFAPETPWGYTRIVKTELKSKIERQLKVIEGQVRGLQKMVAEDKYCIDVITQTSAIRNSLGSVEEKMLESHLGTCVVTQMQGKNKNKAIAEVLSVYKLAKRK